MQEAILFATTLWLAFGFVVWFVLAAFAGFAVRGQHRDPAGIGDGSPGGWRPSLNTTRGLSLTSLYLSLTLVPVGIGAIVGWDALGDDRFGVFMVMAAAADLLTIALVVSYGRLVIRLRRGAAAPGPVMWAAFAVTILGQALALVVLLVIGLPHAPTLFGS